MILSRLAPHRYDDSYCIELNSTEIHTILSGYTKRSERDMATQMDTDDDDLAAFASLWGKRAEGIVAPNIDINRPITASDVAYIASRCPYIQILNIDATFENYTKVHFITAKSGWTIQDLDDGLCTSVGPFLFGGSDEPLFFNDNNADETRKKFVNAGKGTVINQAFETAQEMVELIHSRWKGGIEIIAGSDLMKWALWVAAMDRKMKLIGFEAKEEDEKKRARLNRLKIQHNISVPRPKK